MPDANENDEELCHQLLELAVDVRMEKTASEAAT
jgi:hypothetical protein